MKIIFDGSQAMLGKILALSEHQEISVICPKCGGEMLILAEDSIVTIDHAEFAGPGIVCKTGHEYFKLEVKQPSKRQLVWARFDDATQPLGRKSSPATNTKNPETTE